MKKIIFILSITCLLLGLNACKSKDKEQANSQIATLHNSMISLDWAGTYSGVIPCADCTGIEVKITLAQDHTFQMSMRYQNRKESDYNYSGTFRWSADGGSITLEGLDRDKYPTQYKVGENKLIQLDLEGNVITGDLAQNYVLVKIR
ncbi:MAG: copper resistance protein NlpE [Dysgonamonadaceae bacterium]|nr:copper resistance protein NlpE [Dysgonamonadaceae bacterium]